MKKKKTFSIFLVIVLTAVLCVVVAERTHLNAGVVMDGGTNVQLSASPTDVASASQINTAVPTATPKPTEKLPDVDVNSWELVLVNQQHPIASTPKVAEVGKTGAYFDSRAVDALNDLIDACRSAGYSPHVNLAYVPYSAQEYYFNTKASQIADGGAVTKDDEDKASRIVAPAGQSEHETGLAVDITDQFYTPYTSETIDPDMLAWLVEHCAEYGFIQRYPSGKDNITGWKETYHFRYVGKDAAAYIMNNSLCLEEFLALYK